MRACVLACVRACVRACVHLSLHTCQGQFARMNSICFRNPTPVCLFDKKKIDAKGSVGTKSDSPLSQKYKK